MSSQPVHAPDDGPEYFLLRPDVEKAYGYSHAVRIGHDIKVSGAVSMDDAGNPTAVGDLEQQMKNAYADLEKVLKHYGCTFDDVIVENVYTTNMARFLEVAAYRASVYTKQFPTGTWLEVKGLALPEFMIEIELEARTSPHPAG
jgi:enamine deaminase RidA (YjgF/YER057c/UK114 family)